MNYVYSPQARRDIVQIWLRIARDNVTAADKVETAITENCEALSLMPHSGHSREDLTNRKILVWPALPYENYQIVYAVRTDHIYILRVLHGARRRVWKHGI